MIHESNLGSLLSQIRALRHGGLDVSQHVSMRRFAMLLLLVSLLLLACPQSKCFGLQGTLEGNGTVDQPYLVSSPSDLKLLAKLVNESKLPKDCYVKQVDDTDQTPRAHSRFILLTTSTTSSGHPAV